jgi:hypothetical protein
LPQTLRHHSSSSTHPIALYLSQSAPHRIRVLLDIGSLHIRNVSILVGVLWYLVAPHLRLLGLSLCSCHGMLVLPLGQVVEPRMLQRSGCRDSHLWPELEHAPEKVETDLVDLWEDEAQILCCVHGKVALVLGELGDAGP